MVILDVHWEGKFFFSTGHNFLFAHPLNIVIPKNPKNYLFFVIRYSFQLIPVLMDYKGISALLECQVHHYCCKFSLGGDLSNMLDISQQSPHHQAMAVAGQSVADDGYVTYNKYFSVENFMDLS